MRTRKSIIFNDMAKRKTATKRTTAKTAANGTTKRTGTKKAAKKSERRGRPKTGRTKGGRFTKGNTFGQGNPAVRRTAEYRKAIADALTPAELKKVFQALIKKAKEGNVQAIKEVLDRAIGKPVQQVNANINADELAAEARGYLETYFGKGK